MRKTLLTLSVVLATAVAAEAQTTRVSLGSGGTQANSASSDPAVSADGRVIAFVSRASNLVPGDTNGSDDVFVHDRPTGQTVRVSVTSAGVQGTNDSEEPALSADGRFVAFTSFARLTPTDLNAHRDIYVHDRLFGETTLVSIGGSSASLSPSLSADGRYVAFVSHASNLVSNDQNGRADIFVFDRQTLRTTIVSRTPDGQQGNRDSLFPAMSADGRFVAFESFVPFAADDTNEANDVYVRELATGSLRRASIATGGAQGNLHSGLPALSGDGRYVAFRSEASNLVPGDTNGRVDMFVHDRQARQTTRVNVASNGSQATTAAFFETPGISHDGRFVTFTTDAPNLVEFDLNGSADVFVHDRQTAQTFRVSVASNGAQGNSHSRDAALSADGAVIAFSSQGNNLVAGDTNGFTDIFARVLGTGCDGCPAAPGPPSNLTARIRNLDVLFAWNAPTTGGVPDTYVFRVGDHPGATNFEFGTGSPSRTFEAANVPQGVYYVRVHGRNSAGIGPPSNEVVVDVGAPCVGPPGPPQLSGSINGNSVTLEWTDGEGCPPDSFLIDIGFASGATDGTAPWDFHSVTTPLRPGSYYVRVRGRNRYGTSAPSNEVLIVVLP